MHFGENAGVLINGTVLHKPAAQLEHFLLLLEAFSQEVDLQMKAPSFKIMVELLQIRIVVYLFQRSLKIETFRQSSGQC
ncbi:hypothetical protein D3C75_1292060 [compost metagenome]